MLRINLLDDVLSGGDGKESSGLLYLVGVLVVALCGFVALAGWLTTEAALDEARASLQVVDTPEPTEAEATNVEADLAPLEAFESLALALRQSAHQQALSTVATRDLLSALDFGTRREDEVALHELRFDGQRLQAGGVARDLDVVEALRNELAEHRALRDLHIDVLEEVDTPPSGRARRNAPPALRFELRAELDTPAVTKEDTP